MFKPTAIVVVILVATLINLFVFILGWQRRQTRTGLYFALGALAITFWTLSAGLDYAAVSIPLKVFFAKLEYAGYNIALSLLTLFIFSYVGYDDWLENKFFIALITFLPLSNILLAWTNDWHGWLWSGFMPSEFGDNTVIFQHGPGYFWPTFCGYLMIAIIMVPLWHASRSESELSRRQARLLFIGTLIPVAGNLIYLFQAEKFQGVDWTSVTFSAAGLLYLLALYDTRLLDLAPVARDKLISSLSDGMLVLDIQNRIIDANQSAAAMLGALPAVLIGKNLGEVTPIAHHFLDQSAESEIKTELELGVPQKRSFDVLLSPLRDGHKAVVGRLIVFRDITERKQIESERAAWAAVLQATFDSSSAGILVLDTNGQTLLANKQFAKIWPVTEMQPVSNSAYPFLTVIEPFVNNFSSLAEFVESLRRQPTEEGFIRLLLADERIFDVRTAPYFTGQVITGQVWTFDNVTKRIGAEKAEVLAEERRRISQEAHDGLLQGLVGLRLQLNQWHKLLDQNPPKLHSRIDELQTFVAESIDEMRRFIFALRPAPLETGFFVAVNQLATGMQRYYQLAVTVEFSGPESRMHRDWEQAIFRVIQEALSNIGKHAHATQAWVVVDLSDPQTLTFSIRDNGRGFDSLPLQDQYHGFGLGNMSDRLKSLGGQLTIESQPGQGTVVQARIPYNPAR